MVKVRQWDDATSPRLRGAGRFFNLHYLGPVVKPRDDNIFVRYLVAKVKPRDDNGGGDGWVPGATSGVTMGNGESQAVG